MSEPATQQLNPRQCAAARVLLGWSQSQLAEASRTSVRAISNFESEKRSPRRATLDALEAALYLAGIRILETGGVDFEHEE